MKSRDLLGTNLIIESKPGKAFNLDTVVLSDFVRIPKNTKLIFDFGCGNAAIMLYLSCKFKKEIKGFEIQPHRVVEANHNIKLNKLENRLVVIHTDIKTHVEEKLADIIVSNPPFFKVNEHSKRSLDMDMEIAKHELHLNLEQLVSAARKNINHGGLFFLIHKADRLEEIISCLNSYDFRVKRVRFVHPTILHEPNQVLIEAQFKAKPHMIVMPPLIQYESGTIYSKEMQAIYEGRSYLK